MLSVRAAYWKREVRRVHPGLLYLQVLLKVLKGKLLTSSRNMPALEGAAHQGSASPLALNPKQKSESKEQG